MKYINGRNRLSILRSERKRQGKYRKIFYDAIQPLLFKSYEKASEVYSNTGSVASAINATNNMADSIDSKMNDIYLIILKDAAEKIRVNINTWKKGNEYKPDFIKKDETGFIERLVRGWIFANAARRITRINDTTRNNIKNVIKRTVDDGFSMQEVASELLAQGLALSRYRAQMIARTETLSAWQGGEILAARTIAPQMQKEWISGDDDRVRDDLFSHVEADGQVVNMDEQFDVGGEMLDHPGDPEGSAGNVINCRCVLGYIP